MAPEYVAWSSLYDIMCGSLKIRFSNGCCCIRYHFLVKVSLRFGTARRVVLCYEGQDSFFLFRFVGGGPVSFVQTSLLRVRC